MFRTHVRHFRSSLVAQPCFGSLSLRHYGRGFLFFFNSPLAKVEDLDVDTNKKSHFRHDALKIRRLEKFRYLYILLGTCISSLFRSHLFTQKSQVSAHASLSAGQPDPADKVGCRSGSSCTETLKRRT